MRNVEFSYIKPENREVRTIELSKEQWDNLVQPNKLVGAFPSNADQKEIEGSFELGFELMNALGMVEPVDVRLERILQPDQQDLLNIYLNDGVSVEFRMSD